MGMVKRNDNARTYTYTRAYTRDFAHVRVSILDFESFANNNVQKVSRIVTILEWQLFWREMGKEELQYKMIVIMIIINIINYKE